MSFKIISITEPNLEDVNSKKAIDRLVVYFNDIVYDDATELFGIAANVTTKCMYDNLTKRDIFISLLELPEYATKEEIIKKLTDIIN